MQLLALSAASSLLIYSLAQISLILKETLKTEPSGAGPEPDTKGVKTHFPWCFLSTLSTHGLDREHPISWVP